MKAVLQCPSVYTVPQHNCLSILMIQFWKKIFCKILKLLLYLSMKSGHIAKANIVLFRVQINIFRLQDQLTGIQKIFRHRFHHLNKTAKNYLKFFHSDFSVFEKCSHRMSGSHIIIHHKFSIDSLNTALQKIRYHICHNHPHLTRIRINRIFSCQYQIIMIHISFIF